MRSFRPFILTAILIALTKRACAQEPDPPIKAAADTWLKYVAANHAQHLYLHLDKSIYTNNENIWFTAYFLDKGNDTSADHTLYVTLVDLANGNKISADRFVMNKGISTGYLFVNDSLTTGEYLLIAYTNTLLQGQPQEVYRQPISIRSTRPPFALIIRRVDEKQAAADSIHLLCRIMTDYGGLASGGSFSYKISSHKQIVISGTKLIDPYGEVQLALPNKIDTTAEFLLQGEISRAKLTQHIWQPFSILTGQLLVRFYPEGGDMINKHPSRVAVELRNKDGRAVSATGTLMEDDQAIAEIKTDQYGLGVIELVPHSGKHYKVNWRGLNSSVYIAGDFPVVKSSGLSLSTSKGVLHDSLALQVYGPDGGCSFYIMIHNEAGIWYEAKLKTNSSSATLTLPVGNWPAGIATATIFTSEGIPAAERTFLISRKILNAEIRADSSVYHRRSRVRMQVSITDENGKGVASLFSFASVSAGRINRSTFVDITRFNLLDRWLGQDHTSLPPIDYLTDDAAMDKILLTRFWTRYNWESISRDTVFHSPTVDIRNALEADHGTVYFEGKRLKVPVQVMLAGSSVNLIQTDSTGNFSIPHEFLIGPAESRIAVSVLAKRSQDLYNVVIFNNYDTVNSILGKQLYSIVPLRKDSMIYEEPIADKSNALAKTLQAAVVRSLGNQPVVGEYKSNSCNDYVCMYNYLNCTVHLSHTIKPINGATYIYQGKRVIYRGTCVSANPFISGINGIHITKEFYVADYANFSPKEEDISTTVNWSPLTLTNANGQAVIEFYTNDLTGRFSNIIEGVSNDGVFTGKAFYKVVD